MDAQNSVVLYRLTCGLGLRPMLCMCVCVFVPFFGRPSTPRGVNFDDISAGVAQEEGHALAFI